MTDPEVQDVFDSVYRERVNGKRLPDAEPDFDPDDPRWGDFDGPHYRDEGPAHVRNDAPKPNPFCLEAIPADWLTTRPAPRQWLLRRNGVGVVPLGKVGFTIGSGGVGKTIANVGKAICVATGAPWLGFEPETPGLVVLLLAEETADEVHRRIYSAARCMKLSQAQMQLAAKNIIAVPLAGQNVALTSSDGRGNVSTTTSYTHLMEALKAIGRPISLVIVDPLARWAGSEAETNNGAATRFVEVLESLTELPGTPTVDCTHHKNKVGRQNSTGNVSDARGSTAITDGGRWAMNVEPDGPSAVVLSLSKANYSAPMDPILAVRDRMHGGALRLMTDEEMATHEASKAKGGGKRSIADAEIDAAIFDALETPQPSVRAVLRLLSNLKGASTDRKQARLAYLASQPDGPVERVGDVYRRREV
jgi:hypothetical protein